nr:hypothetical protein [Paenibacillus bovis]
MGKGKYYLGILLQVFFTLVYFLFIAALISDLAYFYDRQMFAGAEKVLFVGFIKQLIFYTVLYAISMFIARTLKSKYKRLKKDIPSKV